MQPHAAAMARRALAASVCALVALAAVRGEACDLCAIYTGSLMREAKLGPYLAISEQYSNMDDVQLDGRDAPNTDNEFLRSSITQVVLGWQVLPQVAVQLNLPLISREYRRLEDGVPTRGDVGGAGDLSFVARYAPISRAVGPVLVRAELLAGLKLPSGDSDLLAEEGGHGGEEPGDGGHGDDHDDEHAHAVSAISASRASLAGTPVDRFANHEQHEHASAVHGHDLALGSGSVDGLFGANLYLDWKRLFVSSWFQYMLRGNGDFGYEYADDVRWEVAPGFYALTAHPWTAAVRAVLSGEHKGRDHQDGALVGDTKLEAVYAGPGLWMTWSDALAADFVVDLPIDQETSGRQIVIDYRIRAGVSWRF